MKARVDVFIDKQGKPVIGFYSDHRLTKEEKLLLLRAYKLKKIISKNVTKV